MTASTINQMSTSDQIVATIQVGGVTLASVSRCGFSCTDEVVRTLKALAGGFAGLARLTIRNKTRGWNQLLALATRTGNTRPAHAAAAKAQVGHGRQCCIQWP